MVLPITVEGATDSLSSLNPKRGRIGGGLGEGDAFVSRGSSFLPATHLRSRLSGLPRTDSLSTQVLGSCRRCSFLAKGLGIAGHRDGVETISMSKSNVRARSVRAHASGDLEDAPADKPQGKSSGTVLPYVGIACLGAILFGHHLGVVNEALEYLSKDLGITENTVLQGWVVSTSLIGATLVSFTGGALADKFGRIRTFQLDAIPLTIGAFLSATAQNVQTMMIDRLLAGIGIGITSAIVPLYVSEVLI